MPPSDVTISSGLIIDGTQSSIQCEVSSVHQGKDVTNFRLIVGEFIFPSGTKTETSGSMDGTYRVTYTQAVTLIYSNDQGQQMQCEVTWMHGTSVETKLYSTVQVLAIYREPFSYAYRFKSLHMLN